MASAEIHRVLFVCLGNICRSPAAEGLFQDLVQRRGLAAKFLIDSAGTMGYHTGALADRRMRAAAEARGVTLTSRARQVTHTDLDEFDWVIAMDQQNFADLQQLHSRPRAQIRLLSSFFTGTHSWPIDVPDPYYGADDGFEYVLDMLQAASPEMLAHILQPPTK